MARRSRADERDGLNPECIGIDYTAGQVQSVEVPRARFIESHVDWQLAIPVREIPAADTELLGETIMVSAPASSRASRGSTFSRTVGDENGNFQSLRVS